MTKQLSLSIKIRYDLTMDLFNKESKTKGIREYYYQILNIPTTPSTCPLKLRTRITNRAQTLG